ncbi:MAG: ABC transporter substrate-binding protein [Ruminococcus sp.]|nr:ABC transporter substrate-binding protein [Ruminococcus sp.]
MKNINANKGYRKIIIAAAVAALAAGTLTGCGAKASAANSPAVTKTEDGKELKTLRVAIMTGQPDQYADFIGTEEGIFEKHGIKLETTEYVAGINTVDAIVNGTADTGLLADFAAVNRIGNTLHDTDLDLFAELSSSKATDGGVYVAPEYADDVSKLADSAGWITHIGTVSEYYNWQGQVALGLDPATQKAVNTDSTQTALAAAANGEASAVVASGSQAKKYEEIGWKLAATSDEVGSVVGSYLVTTDGFIDANADLLADYLSALDESVQFINNDLDSAADRISAKFGIDAEQFKSDWKTRTIVIGFTEEGAANLDNVNEWALGQNKYPEAYNIRDFINTSAIEKAFPDRVTLTK